MRFHTDVWKRRAARAAAGLVRDGMVVGLGSGSTMLEVVKCLAKRRSKAVFVPASSVIEKAARKLGLKVGGLGVRGKLHLVLDGADEVDLNLDLIKGRGGAHTREKILAKAAKRVVIVVDRTKLVRRLGERSPVPVEVLPFAATHVRGKLLELGGRPKLRPGRGRRPFTTDNGNWIMDVRFPKITSPAELEREINEIPGVIENGIFVGFADEVIVGHEGGVTTTGSKRDLSRFVRQKFKTRK